MVEPLPETMVRALVARTQAVTRKLPKLKKAVVWRNLIARFPGERAVAEQFVVDLFLAEAWSDLDAFADAAAQYGSPEIDLRYVDVAVARLQLDEARARLAAYIDRHGPSQFTLARDHQIAFLAGDFGAAKQAATGLGRYPGLRSHAARLRRRAEVHERVSARNARSTGALDYDIYLINLDGDDTRLARAQAQLGQLPFTRIPGVRGGYLPDYALAALTRNRGQRLKGTAGCFLSHIAVWEKVVLRGRPALVLEDDACVLAGLPTSLARLPIAEDFDLCFVNERMLPEGYGYTRSRFGSMPASEAALSRVDNWVAAGTDGYFLSPEGARFLLARVERDGMAGDIDWRLVAYALTSAQRKRMTGRQGFAGAAIGFHSQFVSRGRLMRGFVLLPPLVRQFDGGSVRIWDNELAHAHLTDIGKQIAKRRLDAGLPPQR